MPLSRWHQPHQQGRWPAGPGLSEASPLDPYPTASGFPQPGGGAPTLAGARPGPLQPGAGGRQRPGIPRSQVTPSGSHTLPKRRSRRPRRRGSPAGLRSPAHPLSPPLQVLPPSFSRISFPAVSEGLTLRPPPPRSHQHPGARRWGSALCEHRFPRGGGMPAAQEGSGPAA